MTGWGRLLLAVGLAAGSIGVAHGDFSSRADVQVFIDDMVESHGFSREELVSLFAEAQRQQPILDAIARPAERVLVWHEYRNIFIEEARIAQALQFWREQEAALADAERVYGVPPEYVLAILGVETRFGRVTGRWRVIDALATLAFDYPPRAAFFRRELGEFLLLAREEGRNPLTLTGSYAGAMGYGQFIPSSYRHYAVDFDGDGLRDIWGNPRDAVGSVANYFNVHGWQRGGLVALPVEGEGQALEPLANASLDLTHTVAELERLGVAATGVPADTPATLYRMEYEDGGRYWLGFNNFHVITRYNRSRLYALAVHELSQAILQRRRAELAGR